MKKCTFGTLVVVLTGLVICGTALAQSPTPPPPATPTLAPPSGGGQGNQLYQLQSFAVREAYLLQHSTIVSTTPSGAVWVLERRITYGEAGITVLLMVRVMIDVFDILYHIVKR